MVLHQYIQGLSKAEVVLPESACSAGDEQQALRACERTV